MRRSGELPGRVRLRVYGQSMLPALWPGDVVEIESCALENVQPGEIVLAQRDGRLFLHRFLAPCPPNGFLLRGDSMPGPDPQYFREALLGRLVSRVEWPAPEGASGLDEVAVSLKQYPDTKPSADVNRSPDAKRSPDTKRGVFAACRVALRLELRAKWSRAVGMVFCHCGVARRLALKLHSHGKPLAREFPSAKDGGDVGAV